MAFPYLTLIFSVIFVILAVIQILIMLSPEETRRTLTKIKNSIKNFFIYLFNVKRIFSLISFIAGIGFILLIFSINTIDSEANQDKSKIIGGYAICRDEVCHFDIPSGNDIFFRLMFKYNSLTSIKMSYLSDSDQKIRIGIGTAYLGYTYIERDIEKTDGTFKEKILVNNEIYSNLCKNCFKGFLQKLIGTINSAFYVKITSEEDIKIQYISSTSTGLFNTYRMGMILFGLFYIILGIVGFIKQYEK